MKRTLIGFATLGLAASMALLPAVSMANGIAHREQTANQWKNISLGSAALGVVGLLDHNDALAGIGIAGALYADGRYEHDKNSVCLPERQPRDTVRFDQQVRFDTRDRDGFNRR